MSYEYELPRIVPVSHDEIMRSIGRSGIERMVKVAQPSPEEVMEMYKLATELPKGEML